LKKDEIQIISLVCILIIGIYAGTFIVLINPSILEKNRISEKMNTMLDEIKKNKAIAAKKDQVLKETELVNNKIAQYKKALVTSTEFDYFRDTIRDMANEYEVKVLSDRTSVVADSSKSVFKDNIIYVEKMITLNLDCKYHDFGSFLNRIEDTSIFRKADDLSINKKGDLLSIKLDILSLMIENATT